MLKFESSIIRRLFIINAGLVTFIFLAYLILTLIVISSVEDIAHEIYQKSSRQVFNIGLSWQREALANLLNSFALWSKMCEKVKERDLNWIREQLEEDHQVQASADAFGIYLEDGTILYQKGISLAKEDINKIRKKVKEFFSIGKVAKQPLFFALKTKKRVFLASTFPLSSDEGIVQGHDFLLFAKSINRLSALFKGSGTKVFLSEKCTSNRWNLCYPLKGLEGNPIAYLNVSFPRCLKKRFTLLHWLAGFFLFIMALSAFAAYKYHKKVYGEAMNFASQIFEIMESMNRYHLHVDDLREISKSRRDELGYIASKLAFLVEEVGQKVVYDYLTGLLSRGAFFSRLEEEIKRAKRYRRPLSLAILDLDDFKKINDRYGHTVGDMVLSKVAEIIKNNVRSFDIVGRVGGEEIAVVFPETTLEGAVKATNKLKDAIANHEFTVVDKPIKITVSIGTTQLKDSDTAESLYERADGALYMAKRQGKNRVVAI